MENKNHRMLEKALSILEFVAGRVDGVVLTDVCNHFSMPKSSAHALLSTLANMDYLRRDGSGRFTIGLKAFEVGSRFIENNDFYTYSRHVLRGLVAAVEETAHVGVLEGTDVVYLSKYDNPSLFRMVSGVGKRVPAHATAVGKALLSGRSDEDIRAMYTGEKLPDLTGHTVTDLSCLLHQLEEVRLTGFATEREESTVGIACIGVPIVNHGGVTVMGISVSIPLSHVDEFERFRAPLLEAKQKLEVFL